MDRIKRILLIDDDEVYLTLASFKLKQFFDDVEVFSAKNLNEIDTRINEQFDLVLIDLNLPEATGWMILNEYQEIFQDENQVTLICSSSIDPSDHEKAEKNKDTIAGFISKPIQYEDLETVVKAWRNRLAS